MYFAICNIFLLGATIKPRKPMPAMYLYDWFEEDDQPYGVLEFDYDSFCDLADTLEALDVPLDATLDNGSDPS
jgi:hypothetical protein